MDNQALFSREQAAGYKPECLAQTVLVVGVGAVGQNVLQTLALSGAQEVRGVDMDLFEPHNRTRSPLYPTKEEINLYGLNKAKAVAMKAWQLMTAPQPVMRYANAYIQELGDGAFMDVGVVLSCVDHPRARAYLADKARFHGIPLIEAGFAGSHIHISCYPAVTGEQACTAPCWRCAHDDIKEVFSCRSYALAAEAAGIMPAIQPAAAALAGLQAEAAIQALHGEMPLAHQTWYMDIRTGHSRVVQQITDPHCGGLHRRLEGGTQVLSTPTDAPVKALLQELKSAIGADPTIQLYSPFVWMATCTSCGQPLEVQQPLWKWALSSRCMTCEDGQAEIGQIAVSPEQFPQLSMAISPQVIELSCEQVGLPPLAVVEVWTEDEDPHYFRLPGSVNDLLITVPGDQFDDVVPSV